MIKLEVNSISKSMKLLSALHVNDNKCSDQSLNLIHNEKSIKLLSLLSSSNKKVVSNVTDMTNNDINECSRKDDHINKENYQLINNDKIEISNEQNDKCKRLLHLISPSKHPSNEVVAENLTTDKTAQKDGDSSSPPFVFNQNSKSRQLMSQLLLKPINRSKDDKDINVEKDFFLISPSDLV